MTPHDTWHLRCPMIRINNRDEMAWEEGLTVSALLDRLRYTFPHIIVKIDGAVVPPEEYPRCAIADGAEVQVIHLIAGG
jgi:thiamine biosynthesis protein ThiS